MVSGLGVGMGLGRAWAGGVAAADGVDEFAVAGGAAAVLGIAVNVEGLDEQVAVKSAQGIAGVVFQAGDEGGNLLQSGEQGGVLVEFSEVEVAGQGVRVLADEGDGGLDDALGGFGDVLEFFALAVVQVDEERQVGADGGDGLSDVGDGLRGQCRAYEVLCAHVFIGGHRWRAFPEVTRIVLR